MFGQSDTITEILGVSPAASRQHVMAPTGSLQIRWRSGRRAQEVRILRDVALELAAAIEMESARSNALQAAASRDIDPSARGLP
jgi:hypothetical protein